MDREPAASRLPEDVTRAGMPHHSSGRMCRAPVIPRGGPCRFCFFREWTAVARPARSPHGGSPEDSRIFRHPPAL